MEENKLCTTTSANKVALYVVNFHFYTSGRFGVIVTEAVLLRHQTVFRFYVKIRI